MRRAGYAEILADRGVLAFLWTQFLGAFNDNVFKFVVSMMVISLAPAAAPTLLSWVGALFILPFLLFSGYAGQLADAHSKRSVLVATKALEVVAMAVAVAALAVGRIEGLLAVLFLMATQSAFFSPAKYGIVPALLPDAALSRANGLLEMSTFAAIVLGSALGGLMYATWQGSPAVIGSVLLGIAVVGFLVSLRIPRVAPAPAAAKVHAAPWAGLSRGVSLMRRDRTLALAIIGIAYFWFLGALVQMLMLLVGKQTMGLDEVRIALMGAWLAIGIGTGSLVAGRLSGQKVELGLAPIGAFGMSIGAIALALFVPSYAGVCVMLVVLGFFGGFFIVPLHALVQQRPAPEDKGQVIATGNLLSTAGVLLASGVLWLGGSVLQLSPERIVFVMGLATVAASLYVLRLVPEYFIRFVLWSLTHTVYRIRIAGVEHVPFRGPAVLVCNHLSQVDGFLVGACVQRFIRFMVYRPYYEHPLLKPLLQRMHAIPVAGGSRQDVVASIAKARAELEAGHIVCIFAEGAISRTGNLLPFKRGFERIVAGLDVPVIPVNLDRIWGSIFSFERGRFLWKWPQRIPYPVTVTFGAPLPSTTTAAEARQAVMELGSEAIVHRFRPHDVLHDRFARTARRRWRSLAMADASGRVLTYGEALTGALLLARWLRTHTDGQRMVGIMLPASVGGALTNVAALIAGRIPVNLNFTAGRESMDAAVAQCGISTTLTSRLFLKKAGLEPRPGMVYLEDVLPSFTTTQKVLTAVAARLLPMAVLRAVWMKERTRPEDLATVIFSSGSTGQPKGVMLSHRNVLAVLDGMAQVFSVTRGDRIIGVLPFFHSFGFTGTLWFPLLSGFAALYVPNPMDAKAVGEMAGRYQATMLIGTPTFFAAYIRKCSREEFSHVRYAVVGAEKLREPIARGFREKFGLELLEGYGCTEMAPVVSVNMPDPPEGQVGSKAGTVGHPLPGVVVKVVDPETGEAVPSGRDGLLLVKGPNRMMGYLHNPEATAKAVRGNWYVTGDIAAVDEDGFIRLTDRLSRFSKIAGEMVPHLLIEETATRILDDAGCVVTAVADEQRGERLVLLYTSAGVSPAEVWTALNDSDLPKLWVPKRTDVHAVETIPVLGTGKVDLREVRRLAEALTGAAV